MVQTGAETVSSRVRALQLGDRISLRYFFSFLLIFFLPLSPLLPRARRKEIAVSRCGGVAKSRTPLAASIFDAHALIQLYESVHASHDFRPLEKLSTTSLLLNLNTLTLKKKIKLS